MALLGGEVHAGGSGTAPKTTKADKRKQTIIAIAGVAGVALTYMLYRRSRASAAAAAATPTAPTDTSGGGVAGSNGTSAGTDTSGLLQIVGSQFAQLQTQLGTMSKTVTAEEGQIHTLQKHNKSQAGAIAKLKHEEEVLRKQLAAHKVTNHKKRQPHPTTHAHPPVHHGSTPPPYHAPAPVHSAKVRDTRQHHAPKHDPIPVNPGARAHAHII